jgi:hypothetical protein
MLTRERSGARPFFLVFAIGYPQSGLAKRWGHEVEPARPLFSHGFEPGVDPYTLAVNKTVGLYASRRDFCGGSKGERSLNCRAKCRTLARPLASERLIAVFRTTTVIVI